VANRYFAGAWPFDSSIAVLEWLLAWPAFGIALLSSALLIGSVGPLDDESVAVLDDDGADELDVEVDDPDESVVPVALLDGVPVGALDVVSLGAPVPVGLFGEAGSGGVADSLVDGVTGGTAVVVDDA